MNLISAPLSEYSKLIEYLPQQQFHVHQDNGRYVIVRSEVRLQKEPVFEASKILGKTVEEVFEDPYVHTAIRKAFEGEITNLEMRISGRYFMCRLEPMHDLSELEVVGSLIDISGRKKADMQVYMLAQTLRSMNDAVTVADLNDKILYVNPAFCKLYQYQEEEILGQTSEKLWSDRNDPSITAQILPATQSGGWEGELYNRRKDGTEFPVYLITSLVRDELGHPIGVVGIAHDITERRKAEEAIRQQNEEIRIQKEAIAQQNKSLTDNLFFARRMQESILPALDNLGRHFSQVLLWHRPKEILSGDLYWYGQPVDRLLLALVDCGVNGVAGAFLSVLQYSLLNQVVNEELQTQADAVLAALNEKTHNLLYGEDSEKIVVSEGISIGFCNFPRNLRTVRFCGCNMSLHLLRKGKFQTFAGDPYMLGQAPITTDENNKVFTSHTIPITLGDTIYIFTNGVTNQPSVKTGDIIGEQNLLDFLASVEKYPLDQQSRLLSNFMKEHLADQPQNDDQLLLGIRF